MMRIPIRGIFTFGSFLMLLILSVQYARSYPPDAAGPRAEKIVQELKRDGISALGPHLARERKIFFSVPACSDATGYFGGAQLRALLARISRGLTDESFRLTVSTHSRGRGCTIRGSWSFQRQGRAESVRLVVRVEREETDWRVTEIRAVQ